VGGHTRSTSVRYRVSGAMVSTVAEQGVDIHTLLLRTTYFLDDLSDMPVAQQPLFVPAGPPCLSDVARAITQTDDFIRAAHLLGQPNWPSPRELLGRYRVDQFGAKPYTRVVSIEMRSPLAIVVDLPTSLGLVGTCLGLVLLAERICKFGPRVSRTRKEDLLRAAVSDRARARVLEGRADALALQLLEVGAEPLDRIDLIDPESSDDDLERVSVQQD